jgi:hypothetical protein
MLDLYISRRHDRVKMNKVSRARNVPHLEIRELEDREIEYIDSSEVLLYQQCIRKVLKLKRKMHDEEDNTVLLALFQWSKSSKRYESFWQ